MRIKLILGRTEYDPVTAWTAIKTVEVNIPLVSQNGWQVIGADWEYDKEGVFYLFGFQRFYQ